MDYAIGEYKGFSKNKMGNKPKTSTKNNNITKEKSNKNINFEKIGEKKVTISISSIIKIGLGIISSIGVIVLIIYWGICYKNKVDENEDAVSDIKIALGEQSDRIDDVAEKIDDVADSVTSLKIELLQGQYNLASVRSYRLINQNELSIANNSDGVFTFLSTPKWNNNDIVAVNDTTMEQFTAQELQNEKIILTYKEDDKDVVFYGQFNSSNHWDGECVLNVYYNNALLIATESTYSDGELLKYNQIFKDKGYWIKSERVTNGNINEGKSLKYNFTQDHLLNCPVSEISVIDIAFVDTILQEINQRPVSCYIGNTSDGKYNDDTGNAYLVTFTEDGFVNTLYHGNFVNGCFDDSTGNAWDICLVPDTSRYIYYKGPFSKGNVNKIGTTEEDADISFEKITKIIKDTNLKIQLNFKNAPI